MLADYVVGLGVDLRKFHRLCDILLHKKFIDNTMHDMYNMSHVNHLWLLLLIVVNKR